MEALAPCVDSALPASHIAYVALPRVARSHQVSFCTMSQDHIPPGQPTRMPDGDAGNVLPEYALRAWVVRTLDRGRSPLMTAPIHDGREEEYIYRTWGPTSLILAAHRLPFSHNVLVPYSVQQALP